MVDENDFGRRIIGRWRMSDQRTRTRWQSSDEDPYAYMYYDNPTQPDAMSVAERLGSGHVFELVDGSKGTLDDARNLAMYCDEAFSSPDKYTEFYNRYIHNGDMLRVVAEHGWSGDFGEPLFCINPSCLSVSQTTDTARFLNKCPSCNSLTHVRMGDIDSIPEVSIHSLSTLNGIDMMVAARRNREAMALAIDFDDVDSYIVDGSIWLRVNTDIPQLRVGDNHFIKARVNREVLNNSGLYLPTGGTFISRIAETKLNAIEILTRLLCDEGICLDIERANDLRAEYIDERWHSEYCSFARTISKRMIIKVDSAGLTEMLGALYNIVQHNIGARPIIKRTGKVEFPTKEVLDNISDRDIRLAFSTSEHDPFVDASEVFYLMEDE